MIGPLGNPKRICNLTWPGRCARIALAFAGTALYAASFYLPGRDRHLAAMALAVSVAAGLSWPMLGRTLMKMGWPFERSFDLCLCTMTLGMGWLFLAAVINGCALINPAIRPTLGVHATILLIAGCGMTWRFLIGAGPLRAWLLGLQLPFAAILLIWFVIKMGMKP